MTGWAVSGIMTTSGAFDHAVNVTFKQYYARTDARTYVIHNASWFNFPYPGNIYCNLIFNLNSYVYDPVSTVPPNTCTFMFSWQHANFETEY